MKAIILSAGQGSRLGHMVDDRPKCLIDFNGRTLLDRQLDTLEANGVHDAVVVTGFHDELVSEAIAARSGGPTVRTIFNPFYKVADNTGSLYMAREELAGDCLVWNGDTLVSRGLMGQVVGNDRAGICVTIDRKQAYDDDDMKVIAAEDGRLRAIGKRISEGVNAESIGLLAFRDGGAERFREAIERAMRTTEGTTIWYLRVIHHLAQNGEVWTLDINGEEWGEVDFPADVEAARELTSRWDAGQGRGDLMEALRIPVGDESVSALLIRPDDAKALYLFAHGAGAGMTHKAMESNAQGLAERGIATLRYQFPYMEKGSKRPDPPRIAHAAVRAAVAEALRLAPDLPLFAGGRSFGGRMTSQAQAVEPLPGVRGLAFLGFPLHPAGKPGIERAEHLSRVEVPMLFVSGARDALAEMDLLKPVVAGLGARATLHVVADADHSIRVPAKSGRAPSEAEVEALDTIADWMMGLN